jgi:hypothetical protein
MSRFRQRIRRKMGCSGRTPLVTMMEPTQLWNRDDQSTIWQLDWSGLRAVVLHCQMRAASMIVIDEVLKVSVQTAIVEYDHVIQALAANGAPESHRAKAYTPAGVSG